MIQKEFVHLHEIYLGQGVDKFLELERFGNIYIPVQHTKEQYAYISNVMLNSRVMDKIRREKDFLGKK